MSKHDQKLFVEDNVSEMSYELPESTFVPLQLILSESDLRIGMVSLTTNYYNQIG